MASDHCVFRTCTAAESKDRYEEKMSRARRGLIDSLRALNRETVHPASVWYLVDDAPLSAVFSWAYNLDLITASDFNLLRSY